MFTYMKINFSYFYNCFGFIVFIGFLHQNKTQYCGINMWLSVQVMPRFAYFKGVFSKFLRGVPPDPPGTALALRALAHFSQLINQNRFIFKDDPCIFHRKHTLWALYKRWRYITKLRSIIPYGRRHYSPFFNRHLLFMIIFRALQRAHSILFKICVIYYTAVFFLNFLEL